MSILLGLNTAIRALLTQQLAINTTAHNIANSNTPGYSRQQVLMETTDPFTVPAQNRSATAGQLGTGVTAQVVRRIRDEFLDKEFRTQNEALAYWRSLASGVHTVEDLFNEPSDNGLGKVLANFWNRWRDLTNDPANSAVRLTLREQASELASYIRHANNEIVRQQYHVDEQIVTSVATINSIARQIESLNGQIAKVLAIGDMPNDLRDRRDLLVDQLSHVVKISAFEADNGTMAVTIGGAQLVGDNYLNEIDASGLNPQGFHDLIWSGDGSAVNITGGETSALLYQRDSLFADNLTSLNDFASALITNINAQHALGFGLNGSTDLDFFTDSGVAGQEAATIDLDALILADLNNIAAAGNDPTTPAGITGGPADNSNALAITAVQFALLMNAGQATMDDFYRGMMSTLGSQGDHADKQAANQDLLVQHVESGRQSLSGVSLDEEAANITRFQRAFEGAARMITTLDSMMDTIVNKMGAGR